MYGKSESLMTWRFADLKVGGSEGLEVYRHGGLLD